MVKTFSSGDAVVWRFLSGTWPSQRPVALCLSAMSTSIFQFTHPLCLSSFHVDHPYACHVSCSAYFNSGIAFPLFIYGRINFWRSWRVSCILAIHTHNSLNATTTTPSIDVILFPPPPLLTPLLFLHPFHAACWQTPKLACLLTAVCEAQSPEWSLYAPCPAAVSGDGYWLGPKPHVQSRHLRMPFGSGVTSG